MVLALALLLAPLLRLAGDETAEKLKELRAAYKAKDSAGAVRLFDQLVQSFDALAAREQEEVVKAVEAAFATRRDEGKDVEQLFLGAAAALANMGAGGEKALLRAIGLKHVRSKPIVLATAVEGLGQQGNPAAVDSLLPWLKPEKPLGAHAPVVAGAARALARYREADPALRKRVVGVLVEIYRDLDRRSREERARSDPDPEVEVAFQQIEVPMLASLRALSGAQFENADDWVRFWATARDEDWSAPRGAAPPAGSPPKKKEDGP
jgi:hypothetical protein